MCQPRSLKGSQGRWLTAYMATQCICRAFQVKFPGIVRIPWGSWSGGQRQRGTEVLEERSSINPGGAWGDKRGPKAIQSSEEKEEKPRGYPRKVWNFWAGLGVSWLVGVSRKGQVWDLVWSMECKVGFGSRGVSEPFGEVFVLCPCTDWVGVLCFCLSLCRLLVSLQFGSRALVTAHLGVRSGFFSCKGKVSEFRSEPRCFVGFVVAVMGFSSFSFLFSLSTNPALSVSRLCPMSPQSWWAGLRHLNLFSSAWCFLLLKTHLK